MAQGEKMSRASLMGHMRSYESPQVSPERKGKKRNNTGSARTFF
jgi:hypothetical protein